MSIYYKIMYQQDQSRKQFSVLLNYNKEQSKSDASDFVAMYSKDLIIPPMSKVALYSASLIRKPIVLTEDQTFQLTLYDAYTFPQGQFTVNGSIPSVIITIPKGDYSKREFLDVLEQKTTAAFDDFGATFATKSLDYTPAIMIEKDQIFYSITPYNVPTQYFPISETTAGSYQIDTTYENGVVPVYDGSGASSWDHFAFARSAIFPFTRNHREDYDTNQNNTDWFFKVDLSNTEKCLCGFLSQAYQKTVWSSPIVVETSDIVNTTAGTIPNCYLGLYFNKQTNGSDAVTVSVVTTSDLSARTDSETPITSMVSLVDFELNSLESSGMFGFKFYYENTQNNQDTTYDNYYFKIYSKQAQTLNYYNVTEDDVLFDSRTVNLSIKRDFILDCFSADPVYGENAGLVPFIAFSNVPNLGAGLSGLVSLNTMNLCDVYDTEAAEWKQTIGISRFALQNVQEELKYIFGFDEQLNLDPNAFPNQMTPDNGIVSLYSDSIGYNVEITNVGIKTQNNTINTNPGADRPCVYRLQNEESDISDFNQTYRRLTHYAQQIKWVDLENREALHINNLNIKIRRDVTNQVASEIKDTKLELLFC